MDKQEIANFIKRLRIGKFGEKFGAQKKFADFLGIKYTTYRENERGKIGVEVLKALREKMGVDINSLLSEEGRNAEEEAEYKTQPLTTPQEQEYLDKLLDVLRNPATKVAIQENINTFLKVPKPEAPLEETKKRGGMAS